jgi:hypothetical protein
MVQGASIEIKVNMESSKVFKDYLITNEEEHKQRLLSNQQTKSVSDNFSINDEKNLNKPPGETYQEPDSLLKYQAATTFNQDGTDNSFEFGQRQPLSGKEDVDR